MGSQVATSDRFETGPLIGGFGAEIKGIDVKSVDGGTLREVVTTLERHGAIMLRRQSLSPPEQSPSQVC